MQGRNPSHGAKRQGEQLKSFARGMSVRGVVYGEAWKFMLTRSDLVFKLKGFEVSSQLLVCIALD